MPTNFDHNKFENVLLYILEKCSSKPSFGRTVLYKLLYFSDFDFYELYERPLTGESYRKIDRGPAPCHINDVLTSLKNKKKVRHIRTRYYGKMQDRYIPTVESDLSKLSADEIKVVDNVIQKLSAKNAKEIGNYSHGDVPYKCTPTKEIIDYELVFYRTPAYAVRQYASD